VEASAVLSTPDTQARSNAKAMAGWAKFIGIMTIIGGCLQVLTIFGIVIAWLPIWMGVVLTKAGSKAAEYADKGDAASLEGMMGQMKTYFIINGVLIIVSFAVAIIIMIAWLILLAVGVSLPNLTEMLSRYQ
jgi:hypothetical protein